MRVTVDQQRCIGSGMCVLAVGEVFDQREEDGAVHLLREDVPSELQDRVRHAARVCPSRAITVPQETDA
ncbi:ferredoxin [Streptantibioticus ferralitis]|uniref:Ferredoxin n=2 Tax=Streptantibioticus ferralitis TaxID=236510 RepID=A0ABT5ZBE7_9ACTN|nr:ferredoxin [Streptantibioticus ferralitis]MDF2261173.1 ferredoxin [Streptantibioticus ferralitis]